MPAYSCYFFNCQIKKKKVGWAAKLSDRNQDRVAVPYRGPVKGGSSKGRPATEIQLNTLTGALMERITTSIEEESDGWQNQNLPTARTSGPHHALASQPAKQWC